MEDKRQQCLELLRDSEALGHYTALLGQLQKDFDRANVAFGFTADTRPETVYASLHEKMYQLIMERFRDYLNVLYFVDIPERSFRQVPLTDPVEVAAAVSYLILKREWQKIQMKLNSRP